ncbi:cytochrome c biogenesis protein ResB [Pullulanibacillus sp. KACC 23026]|uniref:cytochrome c biogenesis protein ResB n=1 Tax=Pullulanibacillus sp. KACC 23026 TaxID=3028315 RepID=UPI0023B119B2|nr:cytochrome c biogenesis protein ResB [Pullulanibacillus sp. KACC 23026]WEG11420.1 cytochrome c biogenesis protein ResB [Pullulanibacillus sp. KACC 23026]
MSKQVLCECGHQNPEGTLLCEACGNPLQDVSSQEILTMRYEGGARRSQTYTRTPIDKVWNYFSSVKVGVTLIVLVLIAIAIGTIFPQEVYLPPTADPNTYYKDTYGELGQIYKTLGFDNLYSSWWFIILIGLLGLSIIVASIDRFIPLYRVLKNQRVTRHERFMKRQRLVSTTVVNNPDGLMDQLKGELKKRRYKIKEENGNVLAEKNRFSRWGPYVNHIGLIIVILAGVCRYVPGMYVKEQVWVREGETVAIPGTNDQYYLKSHKFILQTYSDKNKKYKQTLEQVGTVPKNYQTNVTLYQKSGEAILGQTPKLKKIEDASVKVNHPLVFNHYKVFQADYRLNQISSMNFMLVDKKTGTDHGDFSVNLFDTKSTYNLGNGYSIKVLGYFPDFYFNSKNEPDTKSQQPNNPAFIFRMITPDKPKGEVAFIGIKKNLEPLGKNDYAIKFKSLGFKNMSGFIVTKDFTLWIALIGAIIFLIGVAQGMYWNHRRMWFQRKGNELWFAATTNKNWHGFKREMTPILEACGLEEPIDQLEEKTKAEDNERRTVE